MFGIASSFCSEFVNFLEKIEKLYVVVGKTGSRFFGGEPPAKWVIHGGLHRGTRPKGQPAVASIKLDPM
jgi:hypothetical protein